MPIPALAAVVQLLGKQLVQEVAKELVREVAASASAVQLEVKVELDLENLKRLKKEARQAVYRAVQRAAKPTREAVIQGAERIKKYGFLAKSIGTKTRIKKGVIFTVIGPKMSFTRVRPGKKSTRGKSKGTKPKVAPYRYAWILEFGSYRTKPKTFLEQAWNQTGPGYKGRVIEEVAIELAKVNGIPLG